MHRFQVETVQPNLHFATVTSSLSSTIIACVVVDDANRTGAVTRTPATHSFSH